MEADIREFLLRFSPDELVERRILRTVDLFLQGDSVSSLMALMEEHGITRLAAKERDWYLNADGSWSNPGSRSRTGQKSGDSENLRGIFNNQNNHINPFWGRAEPYNEDELDIPATSVSEGSEIRFGLERDLQRALRNSITQLEPGLAITDGGSEKP